MVGFVNVRMGENLSPHFWELSNACFKWISSTFPGLVAEASSVIACAKYSTYQFGALQTQLKALKPGAALPAKLQTQAQTIISTTADMAGHLHDNCAQVPYDVESLSDLATTVAAELKQTGVEFEGLTPAFGNLGDAIQRVADASGSLSDDLANLATGEITYEVLIQLDIPYALQAWTNLAAEAAAFVSTMNNQAKYFNPRPPLRLGATPAKDIGPGALATAAVTGGPAFSLALPDWTVIQFGVIDNLSLPTSLDQMRTYLGSGAPSNMSDFAQLASAYATINSHSSAWQDDAFPATVTLASDVYDFGTNVVPIFYPAILTEAQALTAKADNADAKAALAAIFTSLQTTTARYQANAASAAAQNGTFSSQTNDDYTALTGPNGLYAYYNSNYGQTSPIVMSLMLALAASQQALNDDNAAYAHDTIVAETSPIYSFVFPVGTIASGIVGGTYSVKASEDLKKALAEQQAINTLSADLQALYNLMTAINIGSTGLSTIADALKTALPAVTAVSDFWAALSGLFGTLAAKVNSDLTGCLTIIKGLNIDAAVKAWGDVATAADTFRLNTDVEPQSVAAHSMMAWKVRRQMSSRALTSMLG
jgi:hypothetical protein